ncbi:protein kinase family protein [Microbulbifer sp. CnH-101-G]|uniref:protein kinase family protein n=1 Tax=Microbulbifer sp. CnH-101-G TaxID=3243393 RepID=UPI004039D0E4
MSKQLIKFIRRKDFELVRELGRGACGRTVLLDDPIIDERFVCKKYSPMYDELTDELYGNFVEEIKLLHMINHSNIVRVFNYYLYPEEKTGYILMEYISGSDIEDYLKKYPENTNSVFKQVIEAFSHLESNGILHRDIRPMNILVSDDGEVKVIDFGFGKKIGDSKDFDKSISLNWWCEPPMEFKNNVYNNSTEVYFIGKLFENIILEGQIEQFAYKGILARMIPREPENRVSLFSNIRNEILSEAFSEIEFDHVELQAYRDFAEQLTEVLSKIEYSTKYVDSATDIIRKLEDAYQSIMLEEYVPTNSVILRALLSGAYYHSNNKFFSVSTVKEFLDLVRKASTAKRNIIVANIRARMEAIERYHERDFDDDIPF